MTAHMTTRKPPLTLHIGLHKTGSTYIQSRLLSNRDKLERFGIYFPLDGHAYGHGRNGLITHLKRCGQSPDKSFDIDQLIANPRHVVLSHENLCRLSARAVDYLRAVLEPRDVTVVIVLRDWTGLLYSAWQQLVKRGLSQTLPQFVDAALANHKQSEWINFGRVIKRYKQCFGSDNVKIVLYDNLKKSNYDIFTFFVSNILNLDVDDPDTFFDPSQNTNVSNPAHRTELSRYLNENRPFENQRKAARYLRWVYTEIGRNKLLAMKLDELKDVFQENKQTLEITNTNNILRRYNNRLYKQYGELIINPNEKQLFEDSTCTFDYFGDGHFSLLREIKDQLDQLESDDVRSWIAKTGGNKQRRRMDISD